jgi:hypothetical protein
MPDHCVNSETPSCLQSFVHLQLTHTCMLLVVAATDLLYTLQQTVSGATMSPSTCHTPPNALYAKAVIKPSHSSINSSNNSSSTELCSKRTATTLCTIYYTSTVNGWANSRSTKQSQCNMAAAQHYCYY